MFHDGSTVEGMHLIEAWEGAIRPRFDAVAQTHGLYDSRPDTYSKREFPRLCRGGSRSLTFSGVHPESPCREPPSTLTRSNWMDEFESLSHSKWECKYHVVFIPK